ncbi:MAG: two-component system, OmpR family, sensor kinase [Gaiellaceae bacterium]|nr:two-component system, OmpR family, sensor kinase [Gaiellaceae bacterium]
MSIRLKVTLATVVIAALAVGAADVTTFALLRGYFNRRADANVRQVAQTAVATLRSGHRLTLSTFAGADRMVLVELRSPQGKVLQDIRTPAAAEVSIPSDLLSHLGRSEQVEVPGRPGPSFALIAVPATGGTVIAAVSVRNEVSTLAHLFTLNFAVGGVVLGLLALVALVVLTRSLRPLRQIALTADAIAAGDLSARIPPAPKRSEIGRVATALNRMLGENEAAFAQRDATEERLRRFLADASHELRTPLTSIRGYAELFRRGAAERPEDLANVMRAIEEEAARMSRLVEDLLLLARLDDARPLEHVPVALDDLVERAIEAARAAEPGRLIQFEFAERPLVVEGDPARLRQVIDNLLANVRQHTPADAPAYVSLRQAGDEVVLTVEDTGPGIPAADRELVFGRFARPDAARGRDQGGAGLGLAIVRSIVNAHGGTIAIHSARPHGAVFEVRLPVHADSRVTLS